MAERLPSGVYDTDSMRADSVADSLSSSYMASSRISDNVSLNGDQTPKFSFRDPFGSSEAYPYQQNPGLLSPNVRDKNSEEKISQVGGVRQATSNNMPGTAEGNRSGSFQDASENGMNSRTSELTGDAKHVEGQWTEQYEPGVYITLVALTNGTRDLKRVRFGRRRFGENQAENWWSENCEKVYERYNVVVSDKSSAPGHRSGGATPA